MPLRQGILEDLVDVTEMARHMQPISFPGDSANHHSISNCLLCFQSALSLSPKHADESLCFQTFGGFPLPQPTRNVLPLFLDLVYQLPHMRVSSVCANNWASLVFGCYRRQETWVRWLGGEDSPGERNGNPLQYSCLENPMDRGAWWATVHAWGRRELDMTEQLTLLTTTHATN